MESIKILCCFCKKIISKSNISYHEKICRNNPKRANTRYKMKMCDGCNKSITSQHFKRHLETCMKQEQTSDLSRPSTSGIGGVKRKRLLPDDASSDETNINIQTPRKKASIDYKRKCPQCDKLIRNSNMSYHLKIHTETKLVTKRGGGVIHDDGPTPARRPRFDIQPTQDKRSVFNILHGSAFLAMNTIVNLIKGPSTGTYIPPPEEKEIELSRTAFNGRLNVYTIENKYNMKDPGLFLNRLKQIVVKKVEEHQDEAEVKTRMVLYLDYKKAEVIEEFNFKTKYSPILSSTDVSGYYDFTKDMLLKEMEEFQGRGSGWTLNSIDELEIHIHSYKPLRGGSSYIPLPKEIAEKKAIVNVKNTDQKCFLWSILAALHPVSDHPNRLSKYKQYEHEFDDVLKDIHFPVPVSASVLSKFEKRSAVSVNIYACDYLGDIKDRDDFEDYPKKQRKNKIKNVYDIYPLYITNNEKQGRHVNLLYLKDENKNTHYCWIKSMSRLVGSQLSKHGHKKFICNRCQQSFGTEDLLNEHKNICKEPINDEINSLICNRCLAEFESEPTLIKHREYCISHEPVKIVMPQENEHGIPPSVFFKNQYRKMKVPFVGYADFECILKPISNEVEHPKKMCTYKPCTKISCVYHKKSYTKKYQSHEVASFALYITTADSYEVPFDLYYESLGPDTSKVFVETVVKMSKDLQHLYSKEAAKPMILTEDDIKVIENSTCCHICGKGFKANKKDKTDKRVFDHDHLSGKFRGVAHNSCNLNFKKPHFIPIFIHNLSNYDAHLFIKLLGFEQDKIAVLATNEERYISFELKVENGVNLRFLDSFRFMASSLDSLTKNLAKEKFTHTSKYFDKDKLDLVLRKGIFPYDFMDSMDKFGRKTLPPKESFYNILNKSHVEDQDYEHACKVWDSFNVQSMKEYTLLYNKTDTLLLAYVMENFRDVCMNTYKLDPAWYFTSPGLAWDAMLKKTGVNLELLTDTDMELMITKGIRGGISQCSHRYAKANNKYLKSYDPEKPDEYLIYLDVNNLYGWGMSKLMPKSGFKWCDSAQLRHIEEEIKNNSMISDEAHIGYIFEVDLEYPKELHDTHKDLPLAPENICPPGSNQKKLLTTLYDKEKYVVHYQNLQLYLSLGMKLKKIHRGIEFHQSAWLKEYIDLNTDMRTKATNEFEKDFYKLMNNSVFGKTMENIRKHVDIRLATHDKQIDKLVARPSFKSVTIFAERLAAVHMAKTRLYFNKPIYVGMSILDISKIAVYDFHYNVIRRKYGDNARLQYVDTDSLTYNMRTNNVYDDMKNMIDHFDTSDYKVDNPYGMPRVHKKVIGKWKDELAGVVMREFVGLRSKMYAYEDKGNKTGKKSKGIKKSVVKNELTIDDYKKCLFDHEEKYKTMNVIRSKHHDLYSITQCKKALSPHDDKRYICEDGIETLPWGHYNVPKREVINIEINAALDLD